MKTLTPVRLRIDQRSIENYAALSDDYNPIHTDPIFAAATSLGGVIAHGTLSLNLLLESIERTFGATVAGQHEVSIRFKAPVREGDTVEAGGQVATDGTYDVWIRNQDGISVIEGTARLSVAGEG